MSSFSRFPLLTLILIFFNALNLMFRGDLPLVLNREIIGFYLYSGVYFGLVLEDLLVIFGIFLLFFEIVKSTHTSRTAPFEHIFSMFVFIAFLLEFILVPNFGTPAFLMITSMSLVDVLAGFTISIATARKDVNFNR